MSRLSCPVGRFPILGPPSWTVLQVVLQVDPQVAMVRSKARRQLQDALLRSLYCIASSGHLGKPQEVEQGALVAGLWGESSLGAEARSGVARKGEVWSGKASRA